MAIFWGFIQFISFIALIVGLYYILSKKFKENAVKNKQGKYILIAGLVSLYLSAIITSNVSISESQQTKINGKKMTAEQLQQHISEWKNDRNKLVDEVDQLKSEISGLETKHKDIIDAISNKDKLDQQISDNKSKLADSKDELKSLKSEVSSAKDELSTLKGQVRAAKSAPKTLSAGTYTVGQDIPASRYKVVPIGEGSNFFVNEGAKVNTILGSYGEDSYVFYAEDGDVIKTESSVKLIPIN